PLEDWTIRAFTAWKVGRKGLNDGAALFIFMQDHKLRIEVGYGLEPVLTDATTSRIARNEIAARMKAGNVDEAVTAGVGAILATIGGEQGQYAGQGTRYSASPDNTLALWIFFGAIFIILMTFGTIIRAATRGRHRWYSIGSGVGSGLFWGSMFSDSGSGGGGGGADFGGFSGGGGGGGGGGASASW
ncbi:MAG: TPM domain-containing protein, partial [Candidatus Eremiobacteraeota bacterium]|nr:TPM domain-containing protein [Candidatus Eremiobacteraeota bacterium]